MAEESNGLKQGSLGIRRRRNRQVSIAKESIMPDLSLRDATEHISLCEALDRILNKGVVVVGEVTISVANVDLIYLGLQLMLTSIETAREIIIPKSDEFMESTNESG